VVVCGACGWTTDLVRLHVVAVKLWNDAKVPNRRPSDKQDLKGIR